ncbi:MAG: Zn-ribbon domain-containing OB-fold protein [SAR202 cluster bacterium]|nr:Zn-ribbon domain-containing OB-fold protein [SAR202 cluster bacterium]
MLRPEQKQDLPVLRQVQGEIPISHRYTLGVAGERFFKAMRDQRQLLASPCPKCRDLLLPPKAYCPRCFVATAEAWSPLTGPGFVRGFTVVHRDLDELPLAAPEIVALIGWPEVRGGLVHRLQEVEPQQVALGMAVEPVWATQRTGCLADILHFRPAANH